jgi:hypothetical protein
MIRDDFPDPDRPVTTTRRFLGIETLTFLRLLLLAPMISICLAEGLGRGLEEGILFNLPGIRECFGAVFVDLLTGYLID